MQYASRFSFCCSHCRKRRTSPSVRVFGRRVMVAAAIHGSASLIVTFNLKDFPPERLKPYNLTAQHPDDFIFDLLDLHTARVCEAAANHRRSLKNPPKTADEYLDTLLKQGLMQTVGLLREWKVAI